MTVYDSTYGRSTTLDDTLYTSATRWCWHRPEQSGSAPSGILRKTYNKKGKSSAARNPQVCRRYRATPHLVRDVRVPRDVCLVHNLARRHSKNVVEKRVGDETARVQNQRSVVDKGVAVIAHVGRGQRALQLILVDRSDIPGLPNHPTNQRRAREWKFRQCRH